MMISSPVAVGRLSDLAQRTEVFVWAALFAVGVWLAAGGLAQIRRRPKFDGASRPLTERVPGGLHFRSDSVVQDGIHLTRRKASREPDKTKDPQALAAGPFSLAPARDR